MCQFYKTKQDLLDVLVPYFMNGLRNNEFCVWVTSEFLNKEEAVQAMQEALPDFAEYQKKGQIEIFPYTEWYLKEGKFELERVLNGWVDKHDKAIAAGFVGMRVTGNPFWIDNKKDWDDFTEYEAEINNVIDNYKILVLCTYSLDKCRADEIIDVVTNHKFAMIKRSGKWTLIESSATKKIEEALRKTEGKFANLYASMAEGVALHEVIYDHQGKPVDYRIIDVNPAFERHTGICREEAVGKQATDLYGTKEAPYINVYSEVAASLKPAKFETYFSPLEKHFSISCSSPARGKFTTVFHDITEQKVSQEALRHSEQRWATTLSSIGDAVMATDTNGKVTYMNSVAEELTGWSKKEATQKPVETIFNIIHENSGQPVDNPVHKVLKEGTVVGLGNHTLLVRKDGTKIPIDDSGAPIRDKTGKINGVVLVFRDITERKKSEEALLRAKVEWERTFDSVPDLIAILDTKHTILRVNKAMAKALGTAPELCCGLNCYTNVHGSNCPPDFCPHTKTIMDGKEHIEEVHEPNLGGDFLVSTTPLLDDKGKLLGSVHVARDITTRKKLEKQLKAYTKNLEETVETRTESLKVSEERYKMLFDSIDEGFCIIEMVFTADGKPSDYRFLEINSAFERQTGLKDAKGKLMRSLAPNHEDHWFEIYGRIAVTGQAIRFSNEAKALNRFYDVYAFPVGEGKIRKVGILFNDITERKSLEKQLHDQERMAAIGQTASMVGHDIRNPLQAITGDLYLLKEALCDVPLESIKADMQESIESIDKNIVYINKIVSDLQDYTRPIKPNAEQVNVKDLIDNIVATANIPTTIETEIAAQKGLTVYTDAAYLRRVLTNLVINAIQAMPHRGTLTIKAHSDEDNAIIKVKDTGIGIPEHVKPHLFKPLFTTKSKGQGLGLAVVRRLIDGLGGKIAFESNLGNGTEFTVQLPANAEA